MRAKFVNEAIKHLTPTPEDELMFPDSREAAKYVKEHLFELTGFEDFEIEADNDDEILNPELKEKLEYWYNANKHKISDESEDDYWDEFIDWEDIIRSSRGYGWPEN